MRLGQLGVGSSNLPHLIDYVTKSLHCFVIELYTYVNI